MRRKVSKFRGPATASIYHGCRLIAILDALSKWAQVAWGAEQSARSWIECNRQHWFRSRAEECVCAPGLPWAHCGNRPGAGGVWACFAGSTDQPSHRNSDHATQILREPLSNQNLNPRAAADTAGR